MNTTNDLTGLVDELAAHWAEPTLEILKGAGLREFSIETEVLAWRVVRNVLRRELDWHRSFRVSTLISLTSLMERVLRRSALLIARHQEPRLSSYGFESRVRRLALDRRATESERRLYARIVREPSLHAALKPLSRTDYTPHLRVSAVAS